MSARQKLNVAHVNGAVILGGLLGIATQSWLIFLLVTAGLLYSACQRGDIRPRRR